MRFARFLTVETPRAEAEVDPSGYLAANPDVARAQVDPVLHFRDYGAREKRRQLVNVSAIAEAREEKLSRLRFTRDPVRPRGQGKAVEFIPDSTRRAFEFPDDPPVSANGYPQSLIDLIHANKDKLFLDMGAGLRRVYFTNVVYAEIYANPSTDVICLGEDLPFESEQFDFVFCLAVLEHTKRPWQVSKELCRVTKPGGTLIVDYPFLQPVHGYPHHYFNATPKGHASLFEDVCDVDINIGNNQGPIYSLLWMLREWKAGLRGEVAASFGELTVDQLLSSPETVHLTAPYCTELNDEAIAALAAGSTMTARKRA